MSRETFEKTNLHSRVFRKFPRRTITAPSINAVWCIDLVDMNSDELSNSGYILNAIDILTRYAQAVKISGKTEKHIKGALETLFEKFGSKPLKIWSDRESGLMTLKTWLQSEGIELYHTDNSYRGPGSHSVAIIERFNRTMKEAMFKYKYKNSGMNWHQLIAYTITHFIPEYNSNIHSTTKISPHDAYYEEDEDEQVDAQQERENKIKKAPKEIVKIGTKVHLQEKQTTIRGKKETKYNKKVDTISGYNYTNPMTYTMEGHGTTGYYRQQFILSNEK